MFRHENTNERARSYPTAHQREPLDWISTPDDAVAQRQRDLVADRGRATDTISSHLASHGYLSRRRLPVGQTKSRQSSA